MKQFLTVFALSILLSGCQLIPVKTIGQAPETIIPTPTELATPSSALSPANAQLNSTSSALLNGRKIDVAKSIKETIQVNSSEPIIFENNTTEEIVLTIQIDRTITHKMMPGSKYNFRYPNGFNGVRITWKYGDLTFIKGA